MDAFCCQGGAGKGYADAGFEVVGVDKDPQPRYPFEFHRGDAINYILDHGHKFDAIHASPPCQAHTQAQRLQRRKHPELILPTRAAIEAVGVPGVIENVPGAPIRQDLVLCGSMFGLDWEDCTLYRHRWFEGINWMLPPWPPATCVHNRPAISIFGHTVLGASKTGKTYKHPNERHYLGVAAGREVMRIDWMTREGLSEAIPPVYTQYVGDLLLAQLKVAA